MHSITNWLVIALTKRQHPPSQTSIKACSQKQHFPWLTKMDEAPERRSCGLKGAGKRSKDVHGINVVNASLNFLTNSEDAYYRLWIFVAEFLDADFVEKEKWRYMALNQKMVVVWFDMKRVVYCSKFLQNHCNRMLCQVMVHTYSLLFVFLPSTTWAIERGVMQINVCLCPNPFTLWFAFFFV